MDRDKILSIDTKLIHLVFPNYLKQSARNTTILLSGRVDLYLNDYPREIRDTVFQKILRPFSNIQDNL